MTETALKELLAKCADAYTNSDGYYELAEEDELLLDELGLPYAAGTSVTDEIYDAIERKAKFPAVVGAPVRGEKIKLPVLMGSMTELHEDDLDKWVDSSRSEYCVSVKLDGVSCLLEYHNGNFAKAYSRGDGFEGQDITRHLIAIHNQQEELKRSPFPTHIETTDKITYIRGEIIIPRADIQACLEELYDESGKTYKNSRNTCAGQLNADVCYNAFAKYAHFVAYAIIPQKAGHWKTEQDKFLQLDSWGFERAKSFLIEPAKLTETAMIEVVKQIKDKYPYECDGIIITQNENQESGVEANGLNPKCSRKFKLGATENVGITQVVGIEWNISKDGTLVPRVNLKPITLCGVEITWATGHNFKNIQDMHLHAGVKVQLKRAGDVIPYIEKVIEDPEPDIELFQKDYINSDNIRLRVSFTDLDGTTVSEVVSAHIDGVEAMVNLEEQSVEVMRQVWTQRIVYFGTSLEIDYLGEGNARLIAFSTYNGNNAVNPIQEMILKPVQWFYDLIGENGRKLYESLHKALKDASPSMFYSAVDCFGAGIGVKKLDKLWDEYETFDLSLEQICIVNGWAEKTARQLLQHRGVYEAWAKWLSNNSICFKSKKEVVEGDKFKDYVVVFTGVRSKQMELTIQKNGGKVVSTCTKDCNLVVAEDPQGSSGKLKKARENGVKIISLMEAMDLFKEG